jgi:MFS family permease
MTGLDYNTALAIFYVFYFIVEVPSNIILKKTSPKIWFTVITLSYGFIMTMQGLSKSYSGLLASRSFLGLAEGGLFPAVAFYFTTWYPRYETGFRIAVFFSAAPFAGAIGGFLARGISHMDGLGGLHAWSWIFIIEGLATIVVGCFSYFFFVDSPAT